MQSLGKNLVIVESPAKARTIGNLLNKKKYDVIASVGHIRDLPKSTLGIDIEDNFEPKYITIRGKGPVVKELKSKAKKADKIYLATDPDREGEAISWHLAHILDIDEKDPVRIEFNEITKDAVTKALKNPRNIDLDLVDAQQARRTLDRLVGYKISPLLWKKIRRGLSAGRVQSVAVKLVCERETEIDNFKPEEYWKIKLDLVHDKIKFEAEFYGIDKNGKDEKLKLENREAVDKILDKMGKKEIEVRDVKVGTRKRNPYLPYTTSTLQQDAHRRLNFSSKKTMAVAQQLYEGISIDSQGTEGLITYMRTDSTRLSKEAVDSTKEYLINKYGDKYTNGGKTYDGKKSKESQDAHEAVRPTSVLKEPINIKEYLTSDQYKLYKLIWERFVSSQMPAAVYDTLTVNLNDNDIVFRTSGSKLKFDGFLKVYGNTEGENENDIPMLEEKEKIKISKINPKQHFTQPPARYTEASLIKILEELGIGRPSTFSPTIGTILSREYVKLENKAFMPTELGKLVNELLDEYFGKVINEEFTANLEKKLDDIAQGDVEWKNVVSNFYDDFHVLLEKAEEEIKEIEIKDEETDEICEKCGRNMVIKHGRFGKFLACPGYPECKNTKAIVKSLGVQCPKCGKDIIKRTSKKGRVFYGCSGYPDCDFVSWNEPIKEPCPKCNGLVTKKVTKNKETLKCLNEKCDYEEIKSL